MLNIICSELESVGWSEVCGFISNPECDDILERLKYLESEDFFYEGGVSRHLNLLVDSSIRKSNIYWIEDWQASLSLNIFKVKLTDLMLTLNRHFFLSMKRFESQFAIYEKGGFYKKHIDQHSKTRHRQVSCILYLEDCLEGGELVLYNRDNRNIVDKVIHPKKGTLVTFFSSQIFHEVLESKVRRYGLTSWMRDDETLPLI
ncbi:2OG-Fe(II) oxygenase [Halobacteriovorax sp.]|uniref:2OG-Fe(II) oxygenase n=1 Tax=Halobacteriovorax sp. TaxID=2020862 RepID=UPI003563BA38